ncbi:degenerate transposase [Streptococcus pneumoniae]|nr:degenerate transposase [Streptococcus pneumoniae]
MEKCYTDVTEFAIPASTQKLYLSPVLDGFNSEIIAYNLSTGWQYRHDSYHRFLRVREFKHLCHARETAKTTV